MEVLSQFIELGKVTRDVRTMIDLAREYKACDEVMIMLYDWLEFLEDDSEDFTITIGGNYQKEYQ